jgi:hypothetical protein
MTQHNIKFAIASTRNFEQQTIPLVVESLLATGIPPELIHVFSSGYWEYEYTKTIHYHYHKLEHNSFEYSPLITIVERELESEYWFLLHDTCKVGPNFKSIVYSIPEHKPEKIALKCVPSMSIGSYRYDYLISDVVKAKLMSIKNTDYSEESLMKWKFWGVDAEDFILHKTTPESEYYSPELPAFYRENFPVVDYHNWYNTNTTRRTEYFKSLDLYKNKSNWCLKRPEEYVRVL